MRAVAIANVGEELHGRRPKRSNGRKLKEDEIKAVGPAGASMLAKLTLINKCMSEGNFSPSTTSW